MGNTAPSMTESDKLATSKCIIESRIREVAKDTGNEQVKFSGDFFSALDSKVRVLVVDAIARAKENGRVTLQAHDV